MAKMMNVMCQITETNTPGFMRFLFHEWACVCVFIRHGQWTLPVGQPIKIEIVTGNYNEFCGYKQHFTGYIHPHGQTEITLYIPISKLLT